MKIKVAQFSRPKMAHFLKTVDINTKEDLYNSIESTPEPYLPEVFDFVNILKTKASTEKMDITVMSETSLAKDWLKPEEDDAWQGL
jgi:hypothetical protein